MKVVIEGKNIELTDALKGYVNEKLEKLSKHYDSIIKGHDVKVKLSVEKNPRIHDNNRTEVTIFLDGNIIRSEQSSESMYASIDLVSDKLDRQIQKYKTKHYKSYHHSERPDLGSELTEKLPSEKEKKGEKTIASGKIIKTKKFKLHPMPPEEAVEHLNLIGHDFFVFINSETKKINTVYQRKDGDYGLIEPVID
jgi:putative sigma-54 modulation protein